MHAVEATTEYWSIWLRTKAKSLCLRPGRRQQRTNLSCHDHIHAPLPDHHSCVLIHDLTSLIRHIVIMEIMSRFSWTTRHLTVPSSIIYACSVRQELCITLHSTKRAYISYIYRIRHGLLPVKQTTGHSRVWLSINGIFCLIKRFKDHIFFFYFFFLKFGDTLLMHGTVVWGCT